MNLSYENKVPLVTRARHSQPIQSNASAIMTTDCSNWRSASCRIFVRLEAKDADTVSLEDLVVARAPESFAKQDPVKHDQRDQLSRCGELQAPAKTCANENCGGRISAKRAVPLRVCVSMTGGTMPLPGWLSPRRAIERSVLTDGQSCRDPGPKHLWISSQCGCTQWCEAYGSALGRAKTKSA